jgi:hypothetical protein
MQTYKLNTVERINRIGIGAVLILFTMVAPTTALGWLAVLPLFATLPIFCGIFGYDPVSKFVSNQLSQFAYSVKHTHKPRHS